MSRDTIRQLAELLNSPDIQVTFSQWCISGLVSDCACWRCLKARGIEATDETERVAEERSKRESKAFRERVTRAFPAEKPQQTPPAAYTESAAANDVAEIFKTAGTGAALRAKQRRPL